ncbi:MAG: hypothetical protein ACXWYS_07400 [Gaiellaceae bacterium]
MSIASPPSPPRFDRPPLEDHEALIEEARARTRRRRRRYGLAAAGVLALGAVAFAAGAGSIPVGKDTPGEDSRPVAGTANAGSLPQSLTYSTENRIYVVARNGAQRLLTETRGLHGGEWARDGSKLLAFRRDDRGPRPGDDAVFVYTAGRVGAPLARDVWLASLSPDATRIAFLRANWRDEPGTNVYVSGPAGSARLVARNARPASFFGGPPEWSPDGTRLLYGGRNGLYIAAADGRSAPRRIVTGSADEPAIHPAWSPAGSRIAFEVLGRGIYVARANGTGIRRLTNGFLPAWSPDGTRIAFFRQDRSSGVIRSDGTELRALPGCACSERGPGFEPTLSWSTDGSLVATIGRDGTKITIARSDGSGTARVVSIARGSLPHRPLWQPPARR